MCALLLSPLLLILPLGISVWAQEPMTSQPPVSMSPSLCPPDLEDTCNWVIAVWLAYGPWVVLALVALGLIGWRIQRYLQQARRTNGPTPRR
jgi:hypothetical protein